MNNNNLSILAIVIAGITLLLGFWWRFAWGQDSALTESQVKTMIQDEIKKIPAPTAPTPAQPTPPPAPTEISVDDLTAFSDTVQLLVWSEKADISIIEYSDFECPFCKRHNDAGTIESVVTKYEGKVNAKFAHFPLGFHPLAQKAWEAFECAVSLGADAAAFKKWLFAEPKPTVEAYKKVATDLWLDEAKFTACVDNGDFAELIKDHMTFGQTKFGVRWTPGNVVVNNKTGKFIMVSGAVPATAFDSAIEELLK